MKRSSDLIVRRAATDFGRFVLSFIVRTSVAWVHSRTFASLSQDSGFSLHSPLDQQDPALLLDIYVSDQFGHLADDRFLDGWSKWPGQAS